MVQESREDLQGLKRSELQKLCKVRPPLAALAQPTRRLRIAPPGRPSVHRLVSSTSHPSLHSTSSLLVRTSLLTDAPACFWMPPDSPRLLQPAPLPELTDFSLLSDPTTSTEVQHQGSQSEERRPGGSDCAAPQEGWTGGALGVSHAHGRGGAG